MKKTAFAIIIICVLLFSSVEIVEMANANFMWIYATVEPVPGTTPPSISIYSPQNNTSYSSNTVALDFSVSSAELSGWSSFIHTVEYSLDGPNFIPVDMGTGHDLPELLYELPELFDTSFNLTSLSSGKHSLTVKAEVVVSRGEPLEKFFLFPQSTVYFTVDNTVSSPSPSPTPTPTPTVTPEPTPYEEIDVQNTSQFMVPGGAVALVSIIVFLGLLVYFIKRK
jgi:hypothetical protein